MEPAGAQCAVRLLSDITPALRREPMKLRNRRTAPHNASCACVSARACASLVSSHMNLNVADCTVTTISCPTVYVMNACTREHDEIALSIIRQCRGDRVDHALNVRRYPLESCAAHAHACRDKRRMHACSSQHTNMELYCYCFWLCWHCMSIDRSEKCVNVCAYAITKTPAATARATRVCVDLKNATL